MDSVCANHPTEPRDAESCRVWNGGEEEVACGMMGGAGTGWCWYSWWCDAGGVSYQTNCELNDSYYDCDCVENDVVTGSYTASGICGDSELDVRAAVKTGCGWDL